MGTRPGQRWYADRRPISERWRQTTGLPGTMNLTLHGSVLVKSMRIPHRLKTAAAPQELAWMWDLCICHTVWPKLTANSRSFSAMWALTREGVYCTGGIFAGRSWRAPDETGCDTDFLSSISKHCVFNQSHLSLTYQWPETLSLYLIAPCWLLLNLDQVVHAGHSCIAINICANAASTTFVRTLGKPADATLPPYLEQ